MHPTHTHTHTHTPMTSVCHVLEAKIDRDRGQVLMEMPWAHVMDSASASLSIRLVLFCLSACIYNPREQNTTASFWPLLFNVRRGRGHPGRRGRDIEPIGRRVNEKRREEKEKGWQFSSLSVFKTPPALFLLSLPPFLPPRIHPSIIHSSVWPVE